MPIKKTKWKNLTLNLRRTDIWEGVVGNANDCGRIYVPASWIDKKVFVVVKDGR